MRKKPLIAAGLAVILGAAALAVLKSRESPLSAPAPRTESAPSETGGGKLVEFGKCGEFLAGSAIAAREKLRFFPMTFSSNERKPGEKVTFDVQALRVGDLPESEAKLALLDDGRKIVVRLGEKIPGTGCEEEPAPRVDPVKEGESLEPGGYLLVSGTRASEVIQWQALKPAEDRNEEFVRKISDCAGIPAAAELKTFSVSPPVPGTGGRMVMYTWGLSNQESDCEAMGNATAWFPSGGECRLIESRPYGCVGDSLSYVGNVRGVLTLTEGSATERFLIVDHHGWESFTLLSIPISADGQIHPDSCGAMYVTGC